MREFDQEYVLKFDYILVQEALVWPQAALVSVEGPLAPTGSNNWLTKRRRVEFGS